MISAVEIRKRKKKKGKKKGKKTNISYSPTVIIAKHLSSFASTVLYKKKTWRQNKGDRATLSVLHLHSV